MGYFRTTGGTEVGAVAVEDYARLVDRGCGMSVRQKPDGRWSLESGLAFTCGR